MYYSVTIKKAANGFVVEVGCQTLVFENQTMLLAQLDKYLTDPRRAEREFNEKYYPGKLSSEPVPPSVCGCTPEATAGARCC